MDEKPCTKCEAIPRAKGKTTCKACWAAYMRQWSAQNRERARVIAANSRNRNREQKRAADRAYLAKNREVIRERRRIVWRERAEELNAKKRARYVANRELIRQRNSASFERRFARDPDRIRAVHAMAAARRRASDPRYLVTGRISALVRASLKSTGGKKDGRTWESLVGYSLEELTAHLMSTMPSGYSWQDFLDARLQIDHIIPVSVHRFRSVEDIDFKRCWALSNLQLLPAAENNRKKNTLIQPFQPALLVGVG